MYNGILKSMEKNLQPQPFILLARKLFKILINEQIEVYT